HDAGERDRRRACACACRPDLVALHVRRCGNPRRRSAGAVAHGDSDILRACAVAGRCAGEHPARDRHRELHARLDAGAVLGVGLFLLPAMVAGLVASTGLGRLGGRYGWKWLLVVQLVLLAASLAMVGRWHDRPWQIVLAMSLFGATMVTSSTSAKLIADDVRP